MLSKISIKNFKAIKNSELNLSNINLITGINSSGKSSLLQTILLLKQVIKKDNKLHLNGDYVQLGTIGDVLNQFYSENNISLSYETSDGYKIGLLINDVDKFLNDDVAIIEEVEGNSSLAKLRSKIKYLSAERMGAEFIYDIELDESGIGINGNQTVSFISKNKDMRIAKSLVHPNSISSGMKKDALSTNINEWMKEISPGIILSFETNQKLRTANMSASYYSDSLLGKVTPKNFGFGISYCLPILAMLFSAKRGDILLIENPEAHIHPTGQTKLGYLCAMVASTGIQLIIETHSDHFFNGVRLAIKDKKIDKKQFTGYYFSKELRGEKSNQSLTLDISTVELYDNGKIENAPKGFFDEWQNTLFKLL